MKSNAGLLNSIKEATNQIDQLNRKLYELTINNDYLMKSYAGKVKLRFDRLASQNYKSVKRALQKIILELLERSIA